eukprot:COSAG05_NODE_5572_length_1138_cov_0.833494_1_plen_167_part_00
MQLQKAFTAAGACGSVAPIMASTVPLHLFLVTAGGLTHEEELKVNGVSAMTNISELITIVSQQRGIPASRLIAGRNGVRVPGTAWVLPLRPGDRLEIRETQDSSSAGDATHGSGAAAIGGGGATAADDAPAPLPQDQVDALCAADALGRPDEATVRQLYAQLYTRH